MGLADKYAGIREQMNEKPGITTAITAAVVLIALASIVLQVRGCGGSPTAARAPTKAWFTTDGVTMFADDISNIPPFDHGGKTAYRCKVYKCPNGQPFINHMETYPPEIKKKIQDSVANTKVNLMLLDMQYGMELRVKRPEDKDWVARQGPTIQKWQQICMPQSKDCPSDKLEFVPAAE